MVNNNYTFFGGNKTNYNHAVGIVINCDNYSGSYDISF